MNEAQAALRLSPRDLEIHHTVGADLRAACTSTRKRPAAYSQLRQPAAEQGSQREGRLVARGNPLPAVVRRSACRSRSIPAPTTQLYTVDFRLVNDKVVVRAKVNDARRRTSSSTPAPRTPSSPGPTAQRLGITPITYTLSAGVGDVGLRGLQLARIDSLELGIAQAAQRAVPRSRIRRCATFRSKETESLSPLALGYSMIIDYKTHKLTFGKHLPDEPDDFELPLRLHRLATVRGIVDGSHQANFVVDTGGEVISISQATATALAKPETGRRIALKVYGTSGWDHGCVPDARRRPDVRHDQLQELPGRRAEPRTRRARCSASSSAGSSATSS